MTSLKTAAVMASMLLAMTATAGITIALTDAGIYNQNGMQVATISKGEALRLPEGIYMVKAGVLAEKIIIRE